MDGGPDDAPGEERGVIQIELRLDGSRPAGVATAPGAGTREFTGWVGLMSAVDALAASEGNSTTEEGER